MESLIDLLLEWGMLGLIIVTFTESFCSPILPDVILLPMALANPNMAIYYGTVATFVSVLGGFIGYWIGHKWGMPVVHKVMPAKYAYKIQEFSESDNVSWTIFLAAMSPIPYKCVSISAGAFNVKWSVFIVASIFGRAKRFFLEAVIIYYFGEPAVRYFQNNTKEVAIYSLLLVLVLGGAIYLYKRYKKAKVQPE
ncbi:YqaA family protein [Anaerosinus sp.]|uniref:YqaA family protein n=1 Tax=Selenobaculum sp. TaxID=3074374 RepID=UPI0015B1A07A